MSKWTEIVGHPLWLIPVILLGTFIYIESAHLQCHRDTQSICHVKPEPE